MSLGSADGAPTRVGYVIKVYPRLSETFIVDEIVAVEQAGLDVSVFSLRTPSDGRFHADLAKVRATARYVPAMSSAAAMDAFRVVADVPDGSDRLRRAIDFVERVPDRGVALLVQGLHLARMAMEEGVDHLHAHFMNLAAHATYVAHVISDLPFTVTAHAVDVYRDSVDTAVFSTIASSARAVVTVCDANRSYIEERLVDDRARVLRIYNGVDVDAYTPRPVEARDPRLIVAVGRLVEKKGFHVLLPACRLLLDRGIPVRCAVIGAGEEWQRLVALRAELGLEDAVELVGPVSRHDALAWVGDASVLAAPFVHAADGNRDALPTVLLEAMALGVPVVTTPVGGVPEIVEDGREGLIVDPYDVVGLADAIERLLADRQLQAALGAAARRKAETCFNRAASVDELIAAFAPEAVAPAEMSA